MNIYNNSVGGNATFLLNIPPTPEGLLHENDVKRLTELGAYLQKAFGTDILPEAAAARQSPTTGATPSTPVSGLPLSAVDAVSGVSVPALSEELSALGTESAAEACSSHSAAV